jgi:hypothetical protein
MHIVNQNFVLTQIKEVLFPYRRRGDFDFNLVVTKFEEIVVEVDPLQFQRTETELTQMVDCLES